MEADKFPEDRVDEFPEDREIEIPEDKAKEFPEARKKEENKVKKTEEDLKFFQIEKICPHSVDILFEGDIVGQKFSGVFLKQKKSYCLFANLSPGSKEKLYKAENV